MALPDWAVIIDNPQDYINKCVHVVGWLHGTYFQLLATDGRTHQLITPKTRTRYTTTNKLYHIKRRSKKKINEP